MELDSCDTLEGTEWSMQERLHEEAGFERTVAASYDRKPIQQ